MATLEISIVPIGTGSASVSEYIAEATRVAEASGLKTELTAMGTNLEGDIRKLLEVALQMHESCFAKGVKRVYTVIKIDDRRDKQSTLEGKVQSVRTRLGEG
ncbi:MAG: MTH1187 family thiamine-binding protein [Armatimonadota bacterium]